MVGYLVQILQGLEYIHSRRILHLDLKPENIMVTNLNAIKIVDFGSAQSFNPLSLKHQDLGLGTLEYMGEENISNMYHTTDFLNIYWSDFFLLTNVIEAPEMVKGEVVGPPADIWTIGVVTYVMWVKCSFVIPQMNLGKKWVNILRKDMIND